MPLQFALQMKDKKGIYGLAEIWQSKREEGYIMAIVLTNGTNFIRYTDTGATKRTSDINMAYQFPTVKDAIKGMNKAETKTKNYYVYDTLTNHILWKRMSNDELIEMAETKGNKKVKRKSYSQDARKLLYNNAKGRCELCGRKILFEDMTVDHINPLSMGGSNDVENIACVCYACNKFKGNILPDDFLERITEIFMYQMEKKHRDKLKWKIVHKALKKML